MYYFLPLFFTCSAMLSLANACLFPCRHQCPHTFTRARYIILMHYTLSMLVLLLLLLQLSRSSSLNSVNLEVQRLMAQVKTQQKKSENEKKKRRKKRKCLLLLNGLFFEGEDEKLTEMKMTLLYSSLLIFCVSVLFFLFLKLKLFFVFSMQIILLHYLLFWPFFHSLYYFYCVSYRVPTG